MKSLFDQEFFVGNRLRLRQLFSGTAPIVITANGLLQRNGDTNYLFRQDSSFWYLTGLEMPDAILVMDKAKEYVILPDLSPIDEVFGHPHDYEAIKARSGLEAVGQKEGWRRLTARIKKAQHLATLAPPPTYSDYHGFYPNPARARLNDRLKELNPNLEILDLREHFGKMRMIKQPAEIAAIKQAIAVTQKGLRHAERGLAKYRNEYEIEADLTHIFRRAGAQGHAFTPIVASGERTCVLHYSDNDQPLGDAAHIYLDIGAEVEHYAADITRTYFLKKPTKRQQAIVDAVKDVQQFAMDRLKPGVTIRENEKAVEQYMGEKLRELGLIKTINKKNVRKYYTHACSHYLGLDAHDAGDYEAPLEPGMVLTVEPGIYIPAEKFGVRIEDDVLVTESGIEVLS